MNNKKSERKMLTKVSQKLIKQRVKKIIRMHKTLLEVQSLYTFFQIHIAKSWPCIVKPQKKCQQILKGEIIAIIKDKDNKKYNIEINNLNKKC